MLWMLAGATRISAVSPSDRQADSNRRPAREPPPPLNTDVAVRGTLEDLAKDIPLFCLIASDHRLASVRIWGSGPHQPKLVEGFLVGSPARKDTVPKEFL